MGVEQDMLMFITLKDIQLNGQIHWYNNLIIGIIIVMMDGFGAFDLNENPEYIEDIKNTDKNVYDIGSKSLQMLNDLVALSGVIFWNGSLGLIEKPEYRVGGEE